MAPEERIAQLEEENARLREQLAERDERIAALEARLADLEERVRRNSRNSSMPPSQEGLSKPPAANRAERRAEKRRQGKQPGADGKHLAQVDDPTEVVVHEPIACPDCGADLSSAEVAGVEVRQVFEVEVRRHVTEHRLQRRRCTCGCEVAAEAPREATAPACYGPGVRALACYLAVFQHIPYDRMAQLFGDVLGLSVSTGALVQMVNEGGGRLGFFSDVVRDLLREAPAVHFDETGARVTGRLHWVHVASNALVTLIECHKRRGTVAMDAMGVIETMTGVAVHDGWKPYRAYDVVHALCNSHHLRELDNVGVVWDQGWANEMIDLLMEARDAVEKAKSEGKDRLDDSVLHSIRVRYGTLVQKGWADSSAPTTAPVGRLWLGIPQTPSAENGGACNQVWNGMCLLQLADNRVTAVPAGSQCGNLPGTRDLGYLDSSCMVEVEEMSGPVPAGLQLGLVAVLFLQYGTSNYERLTASQ